MVYLGHQSIVKKKIAISLPIIAEIMIGDPDLDANFRNMSDAYFSNMTDTNKLPMIKLSILLR